jgi:NAD(P)-dependent dehydrogenase (short-subunit alcohol dehydrogenase family)
MAPRRSIILESDMHLKDKVAVITGGASGLGRATAELIIANGGKAALFDLNEDLAKKTAAELGANASAHKVNVVEEESVAAAVADVMKRWGAIHIDVNCAGIGAASRTLGKDGPMPLRMFNFVVQVNLIGTFNTLRLCANEMQKNAPIGPDEERGVIINVASVAAFDGQIGQAAYSASKAGVVGMTLPIARDLARNGIRVCTIAPGIFETPMMAGAPDRVRDPLIENVQFPKRLGSATEFALLARQIIENSYLNGETIRLDAGIRMPPK